MAAFPGTGTLQSSRKHRIDANRGPTRKVLPDHLLGKRNQKTMLARMTFDFGFLAQRAFPEIGTHRLIATLPCPLAFEALRIHIAATMEQIQEKRYSICFRAFP